MGKVCLTIGAALYDVRLVEFGPTEGIVEVASMEEISTIALPPRRFAATANKVSRLILGNPELTVAEAYERIWTMLNT